MRAVMMPSTVSGSTKSVAAVSDGFACRRSVSILMNSSAYSGFPAARSTSAACVSAGTPRSIRGPLIGAGSCPDPTTARGHDLGSPAAVGGAVQRSSRPGRVVPTTRAAPTDPIKQMIDEVQQLRIRPVQILEHQHRRSRQGQCREEASPGSERLNSAVAGRDGSPTPIKLPRWTFTHAASAPTIIKPARARSSLASAVQPCPCPGLRPVLDDLAERPQAIPSPYARQRPYAKSPL